MNTTMLEKPIILAVCHLALMSPGFSQKIDLSSLQTRAEASNYEETTRYEEVMTFAQAVTAVSEKMHLTHFGYTTEGRSLPLIVFGDVPDASPEAARATNKTRVFIQANIHAGEVCGKEAMLVLLRNLASGRHSEWRQSVILLIAPIYNADGNERININHRGRQHGPIGGMGQRSNAQGLDLNRDHMKLDSPEARSLVRLFKRYDPHLVVDLHTTNGTKHAYHLTYSPPLNPNTYPEIDDFLRKQWLPAVTKTVKKKHGWDIYYYGNLPWRGMNVEKGWYTFDHRPRFNNNYVGLRNRFAILSEAYSYASFEERIQATLYFVEEIVNFAAAYSYDILRIVQEADSHSIVGKSLALRAQHARAPEPVDILLGEVEEAVNPYSGKTILLRTDVRKAEKMAEYGTFESTEETAAPQAYYIPKDLKNVMTLLQGHGIQMQPLQREHRMKVRRFRIDSTRVAEKEYQGHKQQTLFGVYENSVETMQTGTVVVPVDQPLGRLIFYLLEPRSDDGLVNWGVLNKALEGADYYPILRSDEN